MTATHTTTTETTTTRMTTIIHHPDSVPDRAAMQAMRAEIATHPPIAFVPETRPVFDALMGHTPAPAGVSYEAATVGGIPGWWCRPDGARAGTAILYLHGGAYVIGSAAAFRHIVGQLAVRARVAAFVPDYRLAPEHPFPAALDDALAAYQGLVASGITTIVLAGDSAGGGLTLVLLALATEAARGGVGQNGAGLRPTAAVVFSPWTDLALTGESLDTRAAADPLLRREALDRAARLYAGAHDRHDSRISPVFGPLADLPPVLVHVGEDEVLLDDSRRYVERCVAAGGVAECHVWAGMPHVFPSNVGVLQAAGAALDHAGGFLRDHLTAPRREAVG